MRSSASFDGRAQIIAGSNDRFLSSCFQKLQYGFNFRPHAAGREFTVAQMLFKFVARDVAQRALRRLLKVHVNVVGVRAR